MPEVKLPPEVTRTDPSALLAAWFEQYADGVYRLALGLLADPARAQDVVQQTFLSAFTHLEQFEGRASPSTWLYRIAYNAAQDELRRRGEDALPEEDAADAEEAPVPLPTALVDWRVDPARLLEDAEARLALDAAIAALPARLRAVFLLRDVEQLSTEAAAESLGVTPAAVKVRLHRARLALRESLSRRFARYETE